ncbi:MAG: hypothetical protein QOJ89_2215, partial [bacterium]
MAARARSVAALLAVMAPLAVTADARAPAAPAPLA